MKAQAVMSKGKYVVRLRQGGGNIEVRLSCCHSWIAAPPLHASTETVQSIRTPNDDFWA